MLWGTYDNVIPGWDADGKFVLTPAHAPHGVYGFDVRLASPGYVSTDPIPVRFIHDPLMQYEPAEIQAAINLLNASERLALPADFDLDGRVDGDDFLTWQANFPSPHAGRVSGDADGDGDVDGNDFLLWQQGFGTPAGGASSAAAVPEPAAAASMVMLVLASAGVGRGFRPRFHLQHQLVRLRFCPRT